MLLNKKIFLKITVLLLISISFFLGYFFRENAVGGGKEFYTLSWPIIQSLKEDFLFTINNFYLFKDATWPFSNIINAYLNPFSDDITNFQLSNTIISFFIFLIFAIILKRVFLHVKFIDILLTSSVIIILPFFRTSAFWGKNENYGWLFLMLALYFFFEIRKNITKIPTTKDIINVMLFCFTSACALYARQALVFLPISYLFYLFFNKANNKIIIVSIISFFIFAMPGILLILTWGGLLDSTNREGVFYGSWLHHKYIIKNIPILLSFLGFYLLPILVIDFMNCGLKNFSKKYLKNFALAFLVFVFLMQTNGLNYLGEYTLGGGALLKLNYLIHKNNFLLLLTFSSIGFAILMKFFREDRNNIIILMPMLIIYTFPKLLYQEYLEPLILLMFFLALKTDLHDSYFRKISFSNFILITYFIIFLTGSIWFKHFAFDTFEKWLNFVSF